MLQIVFAVGEEGVVRGWDCKTQEQVVAVDVEGCEDGSVQLNDIVILPFAEREKCTSISVSNG